MIQMKGVKWLTVEEFDVLFANLQDIVNINSALLQAMQASDRSMEQNGTIYVNCTIFDCIVSLSLTHSRYLSLSHSLAFQEKIKETGDDLSHAKFGELFVVQADGFSKYAHYVNNFDSSLKVLEQLQQRKEAAKFFQVENRSKE